MAPVLDELARQFAGKVKFAQINVDNNPSTASKYGIRGVPALFFFNNGKLLEQIPGAIPKAEIERRLRSMVN